MPELPEVERYRALAEQRALGRPVAAVEAPDAWYLKRGADGRAVAAALVDRRLVGARRRGKLMLLDVSGDEDDDRGGVLGMHFGMTGRLVVDGEPGVGRLLYASGAERSAFDRFVLRFGDGGWLAMRDPRRLGGVELDPDEERLGPDALAISPAELRRALGTTPVALKARLLDQSRVAGIGNLIADEVLWRAGLAPARPAGSLTGADLRRLHRHLVSGLADLIGRGGSHTGDLQPERRPGGHCPKDGGELTRSVVGGRTTWWCPRHQH